MSKIVFRICVLYIVRFKAILLAMCLLFSFTWFITPAFIFLLRITLLPPLFSSCALRFDSSIWATPHLSFKNYEKKTNQAHSDHPPPPPTNSILQSIPILKIDQKVSKILQISVNRLTQYIRMCPGELPITRIDTTKEVIG